MLVFSSKIENLPKIYNFDHDLFGNFGGGQRGGPPGASRGSDLRYNLKVSLSDAYNGKQETVSVNSSVSCDGCSGSGAAAGSEPARCPTCSGMGKVRAQQGFFTVERTCPTCSGRGETITNPCKVCNGTGATQRERSLSVNIPAGVERGTRIRLSGEGEAGQRGGPTGDLYIFIDIDDKDIVIGMLQSLSMKEYPRDLFGEFGLTIVDEVHHISSEVFSRSLCNIVTKYIDTFNKKFFCFFINRF